MNILCHLVYQEQEILRVFLEVKKNQKRKIKKLKNIENLEDLENQKNVRNKFICLNK